MKLAENKIIPYFIGLLEGGGSIQVNHWKHRILQYRVVIKLKYTPQNYILLETIKHNIPLFNLHVRHNYVLLIQNHRSFIEEIIKILDRYSLLTRKKQEDLAFFKYCFYTRPSMSEFEFLKSNRDLIPRIPKTLNLEDMLSLSWIDWWIVGFVEAEGCFCVRKNGRISFSIGQKDDQEIIELVKKWFIMPNKIQSKADGMFVIEGSNRQMLARVIQFFSSHPLLGEKYIQFLRFQASFESPKD